MIVLQLVLFCTLFTLMVKLAVGNNALNALYFYPKPVQERVYELGLTDRETVAKKRKHSKSVESCRSSGSLEPLLLPASLWSSSDVSIKDNP